MPRRLDDEQWAGLALRITAKARSARLRSIAFRYELLEAALEWARGDAHSDKQDARLLRWEKLMRKHDAWSKWFRN